MPLPPARHPVLALLLIITVTAVLAAALLATSGAVRERQRQDALAPFYTPPAPLAPGRPGDLIRTEPLGVTVTGGRALRMLYRSQAGDGRPTVSSGMAFIPTRPAPAGGRPVIAWSHGTVGLAPRCAPSRVDDPLRNLPWVEQMIARGWIVTATDYAGLGTPGTSGYLVSAEEGRDVINSVRAARRLPGARASTTWVAWGHSQGGHAALAAADLAQAYAPDLALRAIAAAAPAADLQGLLRLQWNQSAAWVIGADVVGTWPAFYPGLQRDQLLTANGQQHWQAMVDRCIAGAAITAIIRQDLLGQDFFRVNPWTVPDWRRRFAQNTPAPTPRGVPLLIAQSTSDQVVLPQTTEAVIRHWCRAGVRITTDWLRGVSHEQTAAAAGPAVVRWIGRALEGTNPTPDHCGAPMPSVQ